MHVRPACTDNSIDSKASPSIKMQFLRRKEGHTVMMWRRDVYMVLSNMFGPSDAGKRFHLAATDRQTADETAASLAGQNAE